MKRNEIKRLLAAKEWLKKGYLLYLYLSLDSHMYECNPIDPDYYSKISLENFRNKYTANHKLYDNIDEMLSDRKELNSKLILCGDNNENTRKEIKIAYRIACKDKDSGKIYYYSEHDKDWYSELSYSTSYETYTESVEVAINEELEIQEDWFIVKCKTIIEVSNDPVLVKFCYIEKGVEKIAIGKFEEDDKAFIEKVYNYIINSEENREGKGWFCIDKEDLKKVWHKVAEIEDYTK
jgi:hypothetical protein